MCAMSARIQELCVGSGYWSWARAAAWWASPWHALCPTSAPSRSLTLRQYVRARACVCVHSFQTTLLFVAGKAAFSTFGNWSPSCTNAGSSLVSPKRVVGCRGGSRHVERCQAFPYLKRLLVPEILFRKTIYKLCVVIKSSQKHVFEDMFQNA